MKLYFQLKKQPNLPELIFNGITVSREDHTKDLGVYLDSGLNFSKHIREAVMKATKGISLLKYLYQICIEKGS